MAPIADIKAYTTHMAKSMLDKAFFVDKIQKIDYLLDYGCADGALSRFLEPLLPDVDDIMGYDISEDMIRAAVASAPSETSLCYSTKWEDCVYDLPKSNCAILLSSVIHEVYSYGSNDDIHVFWDRVFGGTFDHVIIRDLIPSKSMNRPSNPNDYLKILRFFRHNGKDFMIDQFEDLWGSLENNKNLIHFLQKYKYEANWEREVRENYHPISKEDLLRKIPDAYHIAYQEHYCLPHFKAQVKKDFDIDVVDNTHYKLILTRT